MSKAKILRLSLTQTYGESLVEKIASDQPIEVPARFIQKTAQTTKPEPNEQNWSIYHTMAAIAVSRLEQS